MAGLDQLVATLVSAVAAVGALVFAWLTVRQTRDLRREDRHARIGELAGDFGGILLRVLNGATHELRGALPVARARLAAAVASSDEPLPACRALVRLDGSAAPDEVELQLAMAVDELVGINPARRSEVRTGVRTGRANTAFPDTPDPHR